MYTDTMLDLRIVKRLREERGLSQEQAAKAAGMKGRQSWWNVESGHKANVRLSTLDQIAKALGVRGRDLLK